MGSDLELVECMHREEGLRELNCSNCKYCLSFPIKAFSEIDTLVSKIKDLIYNQINLAWDASKVSFFLKVVLNEAIPNAVEHGILGIDSAQKKALHQELSADYPAHIQKRWSEKNKPVVVSLCLSPKRILLGCHDSGEGFDPELYTMSSVNKNSLLKLSGRGLMLLDSLGVNLQWNAKGNSVLCSISDKTLRERKLQLHFDKIFHVGVEEFDAQHQKLFGFFNLLLNNLQESSDDDTLLATIVELTNYVHLHLSAEEKKMREYNYPGYDKHKNEHEYFSLQVLSLHDKVQKKGEALDIEVLGFLVGWLKNHIAKTDRGYTAFFRERGVS